MDMEKNEDILKYYNHRNGRLEFKENIHNLLSQIIHSAEVKHELSAKEMIDIAYTEFFDICLELQEDQEEAKFAACSYSEHNCKIENNDDGVYGF